MSKINELKKASSEFDKLERQMVNNMKGILKPAFEEFFELYPEIQAVGWTQYTPYFLDGDPCEFSKNKFNVTLHKEWDDLRSNYEFEDEIVWRSSPVSEYSYSYSMKRYKEHQDDHYKDEIELYESPYNKLLEKAFNSLEAFNKIPEKVWRTFGEGKIIVTRDYFEIEEYDHD